DPAGLRGRTIPLLRQPCQPPRYLSMLEPADFSGSEERWEIQLQRVVTALRPALAPAAPAELDADAIPPIVALPPGSRMPFARNPLFTGRVEELKALARALLFGSAGTAAIAATGLGGIG